MQLSSLNSARFACLPSPERERNRLTSQPESCESRLSGGRRSGAWQQNGAERRSTIEPISPRPGSHARERRTCGRARSNACLRLRTNKVLMKKYYEKSLTFSSSSISAVSLFTASHSRRAIFNRFSAKHTHTHNFLPSAHARSTVSGAHEKTTNTTAKGKRERRND